ncbi:MAG: ATP-grasp domain-containing protein [Fimbriiglobus sp.]
MSFLRDHRLDLFAVEDSVWVLHAPTGVPAYDFGLDHVFACRRPWQRPARVAAIARFGAVPDYPSAWAALRKEGIDLIHDPTQHQLASDLPAWYPRLARLTPRSVWFDRPPSAREVGQVFDWPVFVKGSRQTSRHRADLAVARSADDFERIMTEYQRDPILCWQPVVCRELVALRRVGGETGGKMPAAFEFRTFWWHGDLVGDGPYWSGFSDYTWTPDERRAGLAVARAAADAVGVPFLVVDIAQAQAGEWLVIECNDGQESGYAGVSPFALWNNILERERLRG